MIKGVVGSGKTRMLLKHVQLIRQRHPHCRVLLTCFNRVLAGVLRWQVADPDNVTVRNIDRLPYYLKEETRQRAEPFWFDSNEDCYSSKDFDRRIELCVGYLREHPDAGMFDVVLVDQEEDFDPKRLEFAYRLLKPGCKDFIVARDAAQNVRRLPEWIPSGATGRGRTTILRTNYRNTREVFYLSFNFLMMGESGNTDEIIEPAEPPNQGPVPEVINVERDAEVAEVCERVQRLGERDVPWDEIAVLCGNQEIRDEFARQMGRQREIPHLNLVRDQRDRAAYTENCLRIALLTILKGLQFPHVFLTGLEDVAVPEEEDDDTTIRRFLYVAMTRSTRYLTIMASDDRPYLRDVQELIQELRELRARRQ